MKFGARRPSPARSLLVVITLLGIIPRLEAGVVLNEFMAAAGLRHVERTETGAPRLGSGVHWTDPAFDDRSWTNAPLPAGYGFTGLATDLTSRMKNKA